jgi:RND family efflux transporter MFP subunit
MPTVRATEAPTQEMNPMPAHPTRAAFSGAWMPVAALSMMAAALLTACGAEAPAAAAAAAAPAATPVPVAQVVVRRIAPATQHSARIEAAQRVDVRPRVAGPIEAVLFAEGDTVRRGQPLFRIDPRPFDAALAKAQAELRLAQARAQVARAEAERSARLLAQDAVSAEVAERRASAHAEADAAVAAAQAEVQAAALDREFTVVRSPIDGRAGRALATEGHYVGAGLQQSALTTVVSGTPVHVHFDVSDPALLKQLADARASGRGWRGWKARLLDADGRTELATAALDFADNEIVPSTGTLRLRARVDQGSDRLLPGSFAKVELLAGEPRDTVLIADKAVGTDQGHRYVLAVRADNTLEYRPVALGPLQGDLRVIAAGLKAGDRIVVNGLMRVKPGMAVAPQPSAMDGTATPVASAAATRVAANATAR